MPQLSRRAGTIPASPIRRLGPHADAAKSRGIFVHHLNIGQPDIETPKEVIRAYQRFNDSVLAYGPSAGLPELRSAIAAYFARVGDPVSPDHVFVTVGGSEALIHAFSAVADSGDDILVLEPFYANYAGFAAMLGIELKPITSRAEEGFHLPADEVLSAAVGPRTKAIVICHPGNPTGTVFRPDEIARIGAFADKHDLFIISDEVYRDFVYAGVKFESMLRVSSAKERVIIVDSVSKRFSACGARVGCLVSQNEALNDVFRRLGFARLCPPTVDQLAATVAYGIPDGEFTPVIREYQARRDLLVEGLNGIPGVHTYLPEGAFYTVVTLPVVDADEFCTWLLTDFSHHGQTVMMAPASGFYRTPGKGRTEARIAYVLNRDALTASLEILEAGIRKFNAR